LYKAIKYQYIHSFNSIVSGVSMNKFLTVSFILLLTFLNVQAQPSLHVIPPAYESIVGTASFLGPLTNSQRRYQLLIHESLLTNVSGLELKGLSWRIPASAVSPWPAADISYSAYDFFLSGSVPPADRSLTLDNNIVGTQTQVRSGVLNIRSGAYPNGGAPNEFGPTIEFDTAYLYTGGHLLIELRHTGFSGTSSSVDAIGTAITGYGTMFSAAWVSSYSGTTGLQGNFAVFRLTADLPVPVELTSFNAAVTGNNVGLAWTTATETNNSGFEVQRYSDNTWQKIGFVSGSGTSTDFNSYSFSDNNLNPGNYIYRLRQVDYDGTGTYSQEVEVEVGAPAEYILEQNYPNPFNPSTTIAFALKEKSHVRLTIYNTLGEETALLLNEEKEAGYHQISFNAAGLISGVYFYELKSGNFVKTNKMLLIK
jgi:hypothetical protein